MVNHNDGMTTKAQTIARNGAIQTNLGTLKLFSYLAGGASTQTRVGGTIRTGSEYILQSNSYYLLQFSNSSGSAVPLTIWGEFYEEDNAY
jgi:hypothetical protein